MTKSNIGIRPISGALGAEIGGIDLAERMSEQTFLAIRTALYDNLVILFSAISRSRPNSNSNSLAASGQSKPMHTPRVSMTFRKFYLS